MPKVKRQMKNDREKETVAYFKALSSARGYTMVTLGERLNMSCVTLRNRFKDPKTLTVREIDKICQVLNPDEQYELRLRGMEQ